MAARDYRCTVIPEPSCNVTCSRARGKSPEGDEILESSPADSPASAERIARCAPSPTSRRGFPWRSFARCATTSPRRSALRCCWTAIHGPRARRRTSPTRSSTAAPTWHSPAAPPLCAGVRRSGWWVRPPSSTTSASPAGPPTSPRSLCGVTTLRRASEAFMERASRTTTSTRSPACSRCSPIWARARPRRFVGSFTREAARRRSRWSHPAPPTSARSTPWSGSGSPANRPCSPTSFGCSSRSAPSPFRRSSRRCG